MSQEIIDHAQAQFDSTSREQFLSHAFSPLIKLPPYFKQYSNGFHVALTAANLHLPKFSPSDFRTWKTFNLSKIEPMDIEYLKKLTPAPAIPIDQLRTKLQALGKLKPIN